MKIIVVGGGKVGTALCHLSLLKTTMLFLTQEKTNCSLNHITKRFDIIEF